MSDDILSVRHEEFTYILIPADITADVIELKYAGKEKDFQAKLKEHFSQDKLNPSQEQELADSVVEKGSLDTSIISQTAQGTYQIIPLVLPTKANGYTCVNAYVDNVGRFKNSVDNSRATRCCDDGIVGDCFISSTFDDEEEFKRINFGIEDYEKLLANPPSKEKKIETWYVCESIPLCC